MVSLYLKGRVIDLYERSQATKYVYTYISKCLQKEGIVLGRKTVRDIILRYKDSHSIMRRPGSGRPTKVMNPRTLQIIESFMKSNDEATNKEIKEHLETLGLNVSIATIIRAKKMLGWTYQIPGYCQLIRHVNKTKRLNWAKENITENFEDVIWSDETSVWLERHKKRSYRKKGEAKGMKPRAKHPVKVHVWAGISRKGATAACIFEGSMNAHMYTRILQRTLLPFIESKFGPNLEHRFMQDNDPKHTSKHASDFMVENNINWWKTPPESPDINPIENVWHELKEYIRGISKPKNKEELVQGISSFWRTVTVEKCNRYINHLNQVIPKIIEVNGCASGY